MLNIVKLAFWPTVQKTAEPISTKPNERVETYGIVWPWEGMGSAESLPVCSYI